MYLHTFIIRSFGQTGKNKISLHFQCGLWLQMCLGSLGNIFILLPLVTFLFKMLFVTWKQRKEVLQGKIYMSSDFKTQCY